MPISDYDKRITILTKERGKISAFARGARRPNSQLLAATNPFSFGEFELFEGKSSYNVSKASIHNYFRELTLDVDAAYMGFYFLEFAEYFCQENNDEKEMLKLLYQSLRALESPSFSNALVRVIFELKAMTINGEGPSMFSCMHCHKTEDLVHFSARRGGMFCPSCVKDLPAKDFRKIHESTRYAMQYIISTPVEKLFSFQVSEEVLTELQKIMKEYLHIYVKHIFKSLQIIEELELK
jgi:DNA repair protein RecO (recombination protein O)